MSTLSKKQQQATTLNNLTSNTSRQHDSADTSSSNKVGTTGKAFSTEATTSRHTLPDTRDVSTVRLSFAKSKRGLEVKDTCTRVANASRGGASKIRSAGGPAKLNFVGVRLSELECMCRTWILATVWLRQEHFDWFCSEVQMLYRRMCNAGFVRDLSEVSVSDQSEVCGIYTSELFGVCRVLEQIFETLPTKKLNSLNRLFKEELAGSKYVDKYNLANWEPQVEKYKSFLKGELNNSPDEVSVPIVSAATVPSIPSPEFNPFEVDEVPGPIIVQAASLQPVPMDGESLDQFILSLPVAPGWEGVVDKTNLHLCNVNPEPPAPQVRANCFSILNELCEQKKEEPYNSFEDDSDNLSPELCPLPEPPVVPPIQTCPEVEEDFSVQVVSPPKQEVQTPRTKKRQLFQRESYEAQSPFFAEVEEKDLISPTPGTCSFPSADYPFLHYTVPPDYSSRMYTPLSDQPPDLSFTDKTSRPWNKKRYQDSFRGKPRYRGWLRRMKAKAEAKLEKKSEDEKKEDPDSAVLAGPVSGQSSLEKEKDPVSTVQERAVSLANQYYQVANQPRQPVDEGLFGGVKEAVPPHYHQNTRRVADNMDRGRNATLLNQIATHSIRHAVVHRGAGFVGHRYVMNNAAPWTCCRGMSEHMIRLLDTAVKHAIQSTHKNYRGGGVRAQIRVWKKRPQGGAVRSSRVTEVRDLESLTNLVEYLYTGEDYDDEDSEAFALDSFDILVPEHEYRGGCDSRQHTLDMGDYKIVTPKSNENNCGIACLTQGTSYSRTHKNTIRNACNIPIGCKLTYEQMERVANHINCGFRIYVEKAMVIYQDHSHGLDRSVQKEIFLNRATQHYSLIEFNVPRMPCALCGMYVRNLNQHVCGEGMISFYRKMVQVNPSPSAEFKDIEDPVRSLSEIYVFDLETFPEKENLHTPYACLTQNVADPTQTFFRYGQHVEVMQDILELSSRGTAVEYEDLNPDSDTGSFKYKFSEDKKWTVVQYRPAEYTRDEAVEKSWEFKLQASNNHAYGEGVVLYEEDNIEDETLELKNEADGIVASWCYSEKNTKENVLARIQSLKNYNRCVFVAHNLARFDGAFLLNYLLSKGIEPEFVINGGRILSLRWYNSEVWDTYLFIADSLKNIAKTFKCKVQKGDFDHTLIKTWADVELYKESAPGGMGWRPYLDCDVFSLREIVQTYATNVHQEFSCDVFKYRTLSSMTFKLWGASTLAQRVLIETPQQEKYKFLKDAIYGGRVTPQQRSFITTALQEEEQNELMDIVRRLDEGAKLDEIKFDETNIRNYYEKIFDAGSFLSNQDMNSLYPTAMCEEYPVGISEWSTNPERDYRKGLLGIYYVEFKCPKNLILPILPQRNTKYVSPLVDEKENKKWKGSGILWSLEDGEGVYTSVELQVAEKYGYKLQFKSRALVWRQKGKIFETYIQQVYKIKKDQDAKKGTPEYNQVLRQIAKNMMNSLYGKLCQRPIQDEQKIIHSEKEFFEFAQDYVITDYVWVKVNGEECLAVNGSPQEVENSKPTHLAAFVLSYSRKIMTADFDLVTRGLKEGNFTYTDTDSIHMKGNVYKELQISNPNIFGPELGQLSNDIDNGVDSIIFYEIALAPKCYIYAYISRDGKVGLKKKVKGIPRSVIQQLKCEDFELENPQTLTYESLKKNMFAKDKPFSIENVKAKRTFLKNKWEKMDYLPEINQFRPFGYDPEILVLEEFLAKEEAEEKRGPGLVLYPTGLTDTWYYRQKEAETLPKSRLVKWFNKIGNRENPNHMFSRLNVDEMCAVLQRGKEKDGAYLYEITEDVCRLYSDIDIEKKTGVDYDEVLTLHKVCKYIQDAAHTFGVELDIGRDLKILSACSEKKISFHISSPTHVFQSNSEQAFFWEVVRQLTKEDDLFWKAEKVVDRKKNSTDKNKPCKQTSVIDNVYGSHRCMRTIYSRKPGGPLLVPVDLNLNELDLKENEIESYFIICDEQVNQQWSKLSRPPELAKAKKYKKACTVVRNLQTLDLQTQEFLQRNKDELKGFDLEHAEVVDDLLVLRRIEESYCGCCERTHSRDNSFIKLGKKPYLRCYRDEDKNRLYLKA